jgi:leader peptidase (prepilin peptidase)/N-methyltransferase
MPGLTITALGSSALVALCGAAYAAFLWSIAALVARERRIRLGALPVWLPAAGGAAAASVAALFATDVALPAAAALIGTLVCGLVDARTGFIFDALTLTISAATGAAAALDHRLADGLAAALIVGGALAAIYLITGRRGIGLGDVKLGAALALGLGCEAGLVALGGAFVLGALYAGVMMGIGRAKRSDAVRFGPFIAGGAAVSLTAGALGLHV